jgi:hypothetical protein
LRLFVEIADCGAAGVAHGRAQAANNLMDHSAHGPLIGHLPL